MTKIITLTGLIVIMSLSFSGCSLLGIPTDQGKSDLSESSGKTDKDGEKTSEAQGQLKLAKGLFLKGEYPKAVEELQIARKMEPENADVENLLGLTYYWMQEYTLAIESYQKALELDPKRTDVRNNLGLVYLAQMDYDRALAEFYLCNKDLNYPKKHLSLNNIGVVYWEKGQLQNALAALTQATKEAPEYAKSYQQIGEIYLSQDMYQDAITALEKADVLDPGNPETQAALARARTGKI